MHDDAIIYFVRHGQTDWNAEGRFQGHRDPGLNELGRAQAAANGRTLARLLERRDPDALDYVASPLVRACETMQIIRRVLGLDPDQYRVDDRLREIHYGIWEGRLRGELAVEPDSGLAARDADPWRFRPRGGETFEELDARVRAWLETVRGDTVVVAHGGISRCLEGRWLATPEPEIPKLYPPQDKVMRIADGRVSWHGDTGRLR